MVTADAAPSWARFAPTFPTPHVERVSPAHRVALAVADDGAEVVVWRWYDAVVIAVEDGRVRIWEPAHGDVLATPREPGALDAGTRVYASAGLPGADWWVAGPAGIGDGQLELDEVDRLYTDKGLWPAALGG